MVYDKITYGIIVKIVNNNLWEHHIEYPTMANDIII
jgi:hypothetical protein